MNDYLGNLAAKNLGQAAVIQPRLASLFEPTLSNAKHASLESMIHQSAVVETPSGDSSPPEPVHRKLAASEPVADTAAPSPGRPSIALNTLSNEQPAQPFAAVPSPPAHEWTRGSITPVPRQPPTWPASALGEPLAASIAGPPTLRTAPAQPEEVMVGAGDESVPHAQVATAPAALSKPLDNFNRTLPPTLIGRHAANVEMPQDIAMSIRGPTAAPVRQSMLAGESVSPGDASLPAIPPSDQRTAASSLPTAGRQGVWPAVRPAVPEPPIESVVPREDPDASLGVRTARPGTIVPTVRPTRMLKDHFAAESHLGMPLLDKAPTVRVTIGRIEVRAVTPPSPPELGAGLAQARPQLSLDDYIKQRSGER